MKKIVCSNDHRLLVVFTLFGLEVMCRTCKQIQRVSWAELEAIRAQLNTMRIA
jgi:hypothetical protein